MHRVLLVGFGGFLGSIGRFLITGWAQRILGTTFPWGTAIVNIVGCFLIGFIMTLGVEMSAIRAETRVFITTGILGGLTTFSSFGYETVKPILEGNNVLGLVNIAVNLFVGLSAVAAGIVMARMLRPS